MEEKKILNTAELDKLGRAQEIDIVKENKLVREISAELKKVMRKHDILALSAPAIGYNKRIFCVNIPGQEIKTYVNPIVSKFEGMRMSREACTSIPGKEFIRPRYINVEMYYSTPTGECKNVSLKNENACIFQHELDHLEGVTLEDLGLEIEEDFDKATDEERQEIIDMYLDSLDMRQKYLDENINSDEELSKVYNALKFREAVMRHEVELVPLEEE